jgi:hypothetical protein
MAISLSYFSKESTAPTDRDKKQRNREIKNVFNMTRC